MLQQEQELPGLLEQLQQQQPLIVQQAGQNLPSGLGAGGVLVLATVEVQVQGLKQQRSNQRMTQGSCRDCSHCSRNSGCNSRHGLGQHGSKQLTAFSGMHRLLVGIDTMQPGCRLMQLDRRTYCVFIASNHVT